MEFSKSTLEAMEVASRHLSAEQPCVEVDEAHFFIALPETKLPECYEQIADVAITDGKGQTKTYYVYAKI